MKNSESLKKNSEFQSVYKTGKSYANKELVMYILKNGRDLNRIGISVSKKVGNSVVRHRLKRLVKENYRISEDSYQTGYDIVIVIRLGSREKDYYQIGRSLYHLGVKHGIVIK